MITTDGLGRMFRFAITVHRTFVKIKRDTLVLHTGNTRVGADKGVYNRSRELEHDI